MPWDESTFSEIAQALAESRRVLVITCAGISADSGLPTYRGVGGLYDDAVTEDGLAIEEALSGSMMRRQPEIAWKYVGQIESVCRGCRHNAAHEALVALEDHFEAFTVLTQNVDGFHRSAGTSDLIEMHGSVHRLYCTACQAREIVRDYAHIVEMPPGCPHCGGLVRPEVVLFDEMLPDEAIDRLETVLGEGVDFVMTVGTTAVFPYIAGPVIHAARQGLPTLEINPGTSEVSGLVRYRLQARAIEALPRLAERVREHHAGTRGR